MTDTAFFRREGEQFIPNAIARGPWDPKSINGRVVAGLLGVELERRHGEADMVPARMTVDMYRLPGFDPITIETRIVREGRRIKVVDAEFFSAGKSMARATCQFLRKAENAPGDVWMAAGWDAPHPDTLSTPEGRMNPPWEIRQVTGGFGRPEKWQGWLREIRPIVEGDPITPYARVAAACDFASPASHSGSQGLGYINTDVTLQLNRLPRGEWIGFEKTYHGADDGVAVGQCRLHDLEGPIGLASVLALAQLNLIRPAAPKE